MYAVGGNGNNNDSCAECCSFSTLLATTTIVFFGFLAMIGCGAAGLKGQLPGLNRYWSTRLVSMGTGFTVLSLVGCCSFCTKLCK